MTFNNDKAIYLQMADRLCDQILAGDYGDDARIPSVREYAVLLQVNTNTAMKAYDQLLRNARSTRENPCCPAKGLHGAAAAGAVPQHEIVRN